MKNLQGYKCTDTKDWRMWNLRFDGVPRAGMERKTLHNFFWRSNQRCPITGHRGLNNVWRAKNSGYIVNVIMGDDQEADDCSVIFSFNHKEFLDKVKEKGTY